MSPVAEGKRSKLAFAALAILLGLPMLLCGGGISWWFGRQSIASQKVAEKRELLFSRGLPIDDESLSEFRYRQMNRERSDRWVKILQQISSKEYQDSCSNVPIVGALVDEEPFAPGQSYKHEDQVNPFLDRWHPIVVELHRVLRDDTGHDVVGAIWTPIEFDSFNTLLPHVQSSRAVSRLLVVEYESAVRRDDPDQAFECVMSLIGVARSLEKEPLLISQLVHIAILGVAVKKVKQSVELDLFNPSQLRDVLAQLKHFDEIGTRYRLAIAGERALSQPVFDDPRRLDDEGAFFLSSSARPIDALAALEFWENAEAVDTENLQKFSQQTQALVKKFMQDVSQASWLRKYDTKLTEMMTPALDSFSNAFVCSTLETRLAKIAIALRLYEKQNRRFPASLEELAGSGSDFQLGSTETASGQPFGFRIQDGVAEVWSAHPSDVSRQIPEIPFDAELFSGDEKELLEITHWKLSPTQ
jgi:hypothetical protein